MSTATNVDDALSNPVIEGANASVRLRGAALFIARGYWLLIVTLTVIVIGNGISRGLDTVDEETPGFPSPETIRLGLERMGLPEIAFEVGPLVFTLVVTVVLITIAGILFYRRSNELAPLIVSLFLVSSRGATPPFELTDMWKANPVFAFAAASVTLTWVCSFYWLFLIFPDGHPRPRWTVWPGVAFIMLGCWWFYVDAQLNTGAGTLSGAVALPIILFSALYAQFYRWRRTPPGDERQQVKWAILGLSVALTGFLFLNVVLSVHDWENPASPVAGTLFTLIFFLSVELFVGLIIALGFAAAIFRYRLYDIDIFISRALVYSGVTAGLAALYLGVVVVLNRSLNAEPGVSSPIALVAIVIAFEPMRRKLQTAANRLMFGARDDPYKVLTSLSSSLGATPAPEHVPSSIAVTVTSSLRLPWAEVYLEEDGLPVSVAESGTHTLSADEKFAIRHSGQMIGWLAVQPRTGERVLSKRDRQLIDDLCRQSGPALASLRLTEALQRSRERLVTAREEERRRLRRDLHDGVGPRLAGLVLRVETARDLARDESELRESLEDLGELLHETVTDIRQLVYGLRPPALDDLGLIGALRQIIERDDPTGTRIQLVVDEPLGPLSAAVEAATFRIVQEALTNIARHAPGATGHVILRQSQGGTALHITVSDNGPGIDEGFTPGVGLHSMRERAEELGGTFLLETSKTGTSVTVSLPVHSVVQGSVSPEIVQSALAAETGVGQ